MLLHVWKAAVFGSSISQRGADISRHSKGIVVMKILSIFLFFTVAHAEIFSAIDELAHLSKNNELLKQEYENLIEGLKDVISRLER